MKVTKEHFRGCLLGGATADARAYGVRQDGKDLICDNTQMTSFTLDGLVWAADRAASKGVYAYIPCLFYSYQKWYYTQTGNLADKNYGFILGGELLEWDELFARRGNGVTSLTALAGSIDNKFGTIKNRINNSNNCGCVTRVAPIGLYFWNNPKTAFRIGSESGALTHGHIDAILSSGYYAAFMAYIVSGHTLRAAANNALALLKAEQGHENTSVLIEKALELSASNIALNKAVGQLGQGFMACECAALATYMCLKYEEDFDGAILATMSFSGNNRGVAAVTGNALGTFYNATVIPTSWINDVELADLMVHGADLLLERTDVTENG
ncbi:MAG: ADP-ribosylglycohydrolase family protein [Clostridiales Family XIII bacterium]|jgi:ADP-ribosylglycohydrolase|nr:ADP-ribosylglycohydrolase family protein [Clostridiales Family XIII bacterium]